MFKKGYRVGWPLWKVLAKQGVLLRFKVDVHFDEESKTFWADSPDIDGLTVSADNLEQLRNEAFSAATDLLDLELNANNVHVRPQLRIGDSHACA